MIESDGLLPPLDPEEVEWSLQRARAEPDAAEGIDLLATGIGALLETRANSWPARVDGELWMPPAEHVLDHLVRDHLLDGVEEMLDPRWQLHVLMRPAAGTMLLVDQLPTCRLCRIAFPIARYDTT